MPSQKFLDSIFIESRISAENTRKILENKEIFLICITEADLDIKKYNFCFSYWKISFLPYFAQQHFQNQWEEVEKKITKQWKAGLWGNSSDEKELYDIVDGYVKKGRDFLAEQIKKREEYSIGQDVEEFLNTIRGIRPEELFDPEKPIENTLLYIAIFFPKLSPSDFGKVASLLLEKKTMLVDTESEIINENGEKKIVKNQVEKELIELWQKKPDFYKKMLS